MLKHIQPALSLFLSVVLSATFASAQQPNDAVTITGWDPALRVVTFTRPGGTAPTDAVRPEVEQQTQVSVNATSGFRNRFTLSVLWGWDNQFTGDMIHSANGATTGGVPINITDSSYDDVYGRMSLFKIGAGYRITSRHEAVLNFVWSESAAETVTIGTAGAANVPLNVNFEDYSYWGFEGGQRLYFSRVRFTPFVGYLGGLNRLGDIRGAFVNVPAEVTPGLAAEDGKFFEASWALSIGPTAGLLVGLGPVELMFETQLRYMGGLSDVDWLVEEGLNDINEESSRWSIPFQLGARIRFR